MSITVNVRFLCREAVGNARNGEYLLPDPCTVREFMERAEAENKTFVKDYMEHVLFMVNGKRAEAETALKNGDQIMVLSVVYGG